MKKERLGTQSISAYQQYIRRKVGVLLIMVFLTVAAGLASLMAGSASLSLRDVVLF